MLFVFWFWKTNIHLTLCRVENPFGLTFCCMGNDVKSETSFHHFLIFILSLPDGGELCLLSLQILLWRFFLFLGELGSVWLQKPFFGLFPLFHFRACFDWSYVIFVGLCLTLFVPLVLPVVLAFLVEWGVCTCIGIIYFFAGTGLHGF